MKQTYRFLTLSALLVIFGVLNACSPKQMVIRQGVVPVFYDGIKVFMAETDLELAEASMGANLKMLELVLTQDPENPEIMAFIAQAYTGYTLAFVEDKAYDFQFTDEKTYRAHLQRAKGLYLRARDFGKKAIIIDKGEDPFDKNLADFKKWLKENTDEDDVPVLLWTSIGWAAAINCDREDMKLFSKMALVIAMMERATELDDSYFYGLPHVFLGGYYGGLPSMYGNNKEKSLGHFKKVQQIANNRHLLAKIYQAEMLAVQYQDEAMYDKLVKEVMDADVNIWPEMGMMNALAKKKAIRLKKNRGEHF